MLGTTYCTGYGRRVCGYRHESARYTLHTTVRLSQLYRYDDCAENFILVFN